MSKNCELKFQIKSLVEFEDRAQQLSNRPPIRLRQKDTFYRTRFGRLKLREEPTSRELIFYFRANKSEAKVSRYFRFRLNKSFCSIFNFFLLNLLGHENVVEKERAVYLYRHSRIHCDNVLGLGEYGEFEVVMNHIAESDAHEEMSYLKRYFAIQDRALVDSSYGDMLSNKRMQSDAAKLRR